MTTPVQVTFRNLPKSEAIEAYVHEKATKLGRFRDAMTLCRVVVELPHRHRSHGSAYQVRVDIRIPGGDIVVNRTHEDPRRQDAYAAIDLAFDDAERKLEEHVRRERENIRASAWPAQRQGAG